MHIQLYLLGEPEVLISSPHGDRARHSSRVIEPDLQGEYKRFFLCLHV